MYSSLDFYSKLKKKVDFNIYGQIGGVSSFSGHILGVTIAAGVPAEQNIEINHSNIYTSLPDSVKSKIKNEFDYYEYVVVEVENIIKYIGIPWIISGSLNDVTPSYGTIKLNNFNEGDIPRLRTILENSGYKIDGIEVRT